MEILNYPHEVLRFKTRSIKNVDRNIITCAQEMLTTMQAEGGVGLAANQVGIPLRMFVMDLEGSELCFINPVCRAFGKTVEKHEGCLSFPDLQLPVKRRHQCKFTAWDLHGNEVDETCSGDMARIIQHEIDHLDGVLFIDRVSQTVMSQPRVLRELTGMQDARVKYPTMFPYGEFNEILYEYTDIERPIEE